MALITANTIKTKLQAAYNQTFAKQTTSPNIALASTNGIYGTKPALSTFKAAVDSTISSATHIKISYIVAAVKPFLNKLAKMRCYQIYTYSTTATYNVNGVVIMTSSNRGITCLSDDYIDNYYCLSNADNTQNIVINYVNYNAISGFPQQDQRIDIQNNTYEDTEKIMMTGLTAYFNRIVETFNMNMNNPSVLFMTSTCHSNCHSSCHGSRGRR